jgi:hypothetical protein
MKQQINEFKRMQQLAGIITESEAKKISKYILTDENGEPILNDIDEPMLNDEAIGAYLKSVVGPERAKDVDDFINDDSIYGESKDYFFNAELNPNFYSIPDSKFEKFAKQEFSHWEEYKTKQSKPKTPEEIANAKKSKAFWDEYYAKNPEAEASAQAFLDQYYKSGKVDGWVN